MAVKCGINHSDFGIVWPIGKRRIFWLSVFLLKMLILETWGGMCRFGVLSPPGFSCNSIFCWTLLPLKILFLQPSRRSRLNKKRLSSSLSGRLFMVMGTLESSLRWWIRFVVSFFGRRRKPDTIQEFLLHPSLRENSRLWLIEACMLMWDLWMRGIIEYVGRIGKTPKWCVAPYKFSYVSLGFSYDLRFFFLINR